jgi:hypothetical protein
LVAAVITILSLVALLIGRSVDEPQSHAPHGEPPISVVFTSLVQDDTDKWQPIRTRDVPFRPGRSGYGWVAEMPSSTEVAVIEMLSLPRPATTWPTTMVITEDGRVGTETRHQTPTANRLHHFWTTAEGDPTGEYELTVSINSVVSRFRFRVTAENPV